MTSTTSPSQQQPEADDISSLTELVAVRARATPDAPAIGAPGQQALSYAGLHDLIVATGARLHELGLAGRRIAIVGPNGPRAATAFLGVSAAAAAAPLNPSYTEAELSFYLQDLDAAAVVVAPESMAAVGPVARRAGVTVLRIDAPADGPAGTFELAVEPGTGPERETRPAGDIALLLHTSGTTSRPKMVPLTHANLAASARAVATTLALTPDDRCLNVMPLFHIHGIVAALLASLHAGGSVCCTAGFDGTSVLRWLDGEGPTWCTAVPTIHQALLSAVRRADSKPAHRLRLIRSSSAALPPQVMSELEDAFGVPVIEAYGMTEAAHQMASNPLPPATRKPGTVGLAAGPEVAVLDAAGRTLPAGEVGEVAIRGANVTAGYLDNLEANAAAFTEDGWLRTGDQGVLDEDGYLRLTGRLKEQINRGGQKISPREIDEVLLDHPAVSQAVAFAVPHRTLGEEVAAAVVLAAGVTAGPEDLRRFASSRLAPYKVPRQVLVLDELPKGSTGKVQRIGLAEKLGLDQPATTSTDDDVVPTEGDAAAIEARIAEMFQQLLELEHPAGPDDDFFSLGGNSLLAVELVVWMEEAFGVTLPVARLFTGPTVAEMARTVIEDPGAGAVHVLAASGTGTPLFCFHAWGGPVALYRNLADQLGDERPVFGVLAQRVETGQTPVGSIEEMAANALAEIREHQPEGPYVLAGHCMGGLIALEAANQLTRAGQQVELVAMFDTRVPQRRGSLLHQFERAWKFARLGPRSAIRVVRNRIGARAAARVPEGGLKPIESFDAVRDVNRAAMNRYVPPAWAGRLLVVRSEGRAGRWGDPSLGWEDLTAEGLDVQEAPGVHDCMFRDPNVERTAEILRTAIAEAVSQPTPGTPR